VPGVLFLILFLGIAGWIVGKGVSQFVSNERSPERAEPVAVVRKIEDCWLDPGTNVMQTTLMIVFDLETGEIRCTVPARIYREIPEGVCGTLTHQGTRFRQFDFDGRTVSK